MDLIVSDHCSLPFALLLSFIHSYRNESSEISLKPPTTVAGANEIPAFEEYQNEPLMLNCAFYLFRVAQIMGHNEIF